MTKKMIINAIDAEEVRIAILDNGVLEDFDIEARGIEKNKGNIYKGIVMGVEPALNAAFVDYGADKHGFLTADNIRPPDGFDGAHRVQNLLKDRQEVLVQVQQDEVGTKGAVLSTYLSLAGRYLVLMPQSSRQGVSHRIDDDEDREELKELVRSLVVPKNMGVILRTASHGRTKTDLNRDVKLLVRLWDTIEKKAARSRAPALIFKEQDLVIRALRDYLATDVDEVVLDSDDAYDRAEEYMTLVMPKQRSVLTRYVERRPIFHHYRIEDQLELLYSRKVPLQSGGSLVVEPTEALVSIDVNSGKKKSSDQEDTALHTNLDAAREVARQLRLRDLGGIVVVDFIDMALRRNRQAVEGELRKALRTDKARVKVGRISSNGTLELTRQRIRSALRVSVFRRCPTCDGAGHTQHPAAHARAVVRRLRDRASKGDLKAAIVKVESEVANLLRTEKWSYIQDIEHTYQISVQIQIEHSLKPGQVDLAFETDATKEPLEFSEPDFGPAPRLDGDDTPDPDDEVDDEIAEEAEEREMSAEEALDMEDPDPEADDEPDARPDARNDARPERARTRGRRAHTPSDRDLLAMPTFELLDPSSVKGRGREERGERPERARRGRGERGGRGAGRDREKSNGHRVGGPPIVDATELLASLPRPQARPQQVVVPAKMVPVPEARAELTRESEPPAKKSFLQRLFGLR